VLGYWRIERALGKERTEGRALARRILVISKDNFLAIFGQL
jgi:hypothetical protein